MFHPIKSSFPPPIDEQTASMKAVVKFDNAAYVTLLNLFVSLATSDSHAFLKINKNCLSRSQVQECTSYKELHDKK
jgi:hypothetical protein